MNTLIGGGLNWTHPLLQQINRQGDIIQYADQARRAEEQNAMQRQLFNVQMLDRLTGLQEKNALRQSLMGAGDSSDLEKVGLQLIKGGNPAGLDLIMKARELNAKGGYSLKPGETRYDASGKPIASNEASQLTGDAKNLESILGRKPTLSELENFKRAGAQTINMPKIELGRETSLVDSAVKILPEARKEANAGRISMNRIDQALDILEKHGDTVAGIPGLFRRYLAPFAKTIGMDVDKATDAELLNSLLTEGAGSLRSIVIGSGPVSNYEQNILKQVSGGKMSYAQGVEAILSHHREGISAIIDNYNDQVDAISKIKGYENAASIFKQIPYKKREKKAINPSDGITPDYTKMTDAELVEFIRQGGK